MSVDRSQTVDVRPHAYDPVPNPELFEGVLARRTFAFLIDLVIVGIPVVLAGLFIFLFGVVTFGLGWLLFWLLHAGGHHVGAVLLRLHARQPGLGDHRHADHGYRDAHLVRRPGYFVLGALMRRAYWISVSVLTPLVLLVGFLNNRRRLLHDFLLGTVVINNPARFGHVREV